MIKSFEEFKYNEEIYDLQDKLQKEIVDDGKIINGFDSSFEMSGSIYWVNDDYMFYATPYWEDYIDKSPVEILDNYGNQIDSFEEEIGTLTSEDEIPKIKEKYYKMVDRVSKRLVDRSIKSKTLLKIYDDIPDSDLKDKLGNYDNNYADMYSFYQLDLDKFDDVYNEIVNTYPELISAIDYNL